MGSPTRYSTRFGFAAAVRSGLALAGVCATLVAAGPLATADPYLAGGYPPVEVPVDWGPPQPGYMAAADYQRDHPDAAPMGANDFGCRPTPAHPRPVVLVHGTDGSAYANWSVLGAELSAAGFCVFAPNYGGVGGDRHYGVGDVWASSHQVGDFITRVRTATGAAQVDVVGFSEGASVSRYWIDKLGGAPAVDQWIGLASPSYGGDMYGLVPLVRQNPNLLDLVQEFTNLATVQQAAGSQFVTELNAGGDTVPGVRYTTVGSRFDEAVQPFENIALHGPGAVNLVLQDLCPPDQTGHFHMVFDPFVAQLVLQLLDPGNAPAPVCQPVPFGTGLLDSLIAGHQP
ncbi:alpha/beta fold hydrolase [Nocardia stercoris]|uniref:Alpha/beta fold hydrolase n=1 Tax=Nocardia stercoris TaxID=2483361 RepID=A0A3M2KX40_9NOCA|nr:alpha/beta fold hydrolase [Nocardia stercoris]RMI28075.1 alpha/beta fold hydrolase [Nocardia stercoris]